VGIERHRVAVVGLGEDEARVPPVRVEPGAGAQAGQGVEVQLVAGRVESQPPFDLDLAGPRVGRHSEAPHDSVAVQPGIVESHLAAVVGLQGLEIVDAEEHPEMDPQSSEGIHRQEGGGVVGTGVLGVDEVGYPGGHHASSSGVAAHGAELTGGR